MGCEISTTHIRAAQLSQCLKKREVELVRSSWELVKPDMEDTGVLILSTLLENEKSLRPLFLRLAQDPLDFRLDERKLRRHATMVMEALGAAVESLDDSATLVPILHSLGQTHSDYMVKPNMLPKLWPAIDEGLRIKLGLRYDGQVAQAWKTVFFFLISKMKEGMRKTST